MDKLDFVISNKANIVFEFQKFDVEMLPYIPQPVKMEIVKNYLNFILEEGNIVDNYYAAEFSVILDIINRCTNIDTQKIDFEVVESSGLWDLIVTRLENYSELRQDIQAVLKQHFEQQSIENGLNKLFEKLGDKLLGLLDKISKLDLSKEGVAELVGSLNQQIEKFDKDFPNNGIVAPAKRKRKAVKKEE